MTHSYVSNPPDHSVLSSPIKRFLVDNIQDHPGDITQVAATHFGVTAQAINRHLRELVAADLLESTGQTRARRYSLKAWEMSFKVPLSPGLEEHQLWRERVLPHLQDIERSADILFHGFTEMVNNAIDHSDGSTLYVAVRRTALATQFVIHDDGVGIFKKISQALALPEERDAVLQLTKGKVTTDPQRHSGEGIFFTSRMFDTFVIMSGHLFFYHMPDDSDWLLEKIEDKPGTFVRMSIATNTTRTTASVFRQYTQPGTYGFNVTHVPVALAQHGKENLVSRSQAKRVVAGFEKFAEVIMDFDGVEEIGQAFADEIFRVFRTNHPEVKLYAVRTTPAVESMIRHVGASLDTSGDVFAKDAS